MDDRKSEIARLRALWLQQAQDAQAARDAAQRERLERHRERLQSGLWKPDCTCNSCLTAVLDLNPSMVCARGKTLSRWW
jgi:hypothetical protein